MVVLGTASTYASVGSLLSGLNNFTRDNRIKYQLDVISFLYEILFTSDDILYCNHFKSIIFMLCGVLYPTICVLNVEFCHRCILELLVLKNGTFLRVS